MFVLIYCILVELVVGWSVWSDCPTPYSCRRDLQSRNRTVDGIFQEENRTCSEDKCIDWQLGLKWSPCSKQCNNGTQTRHVECMREAKEYVNETYCTIRNSIPTPKPNETQKCNEHSCDGWLKGKWGACSESCGPGIQYRNVTCPNPDCTNTQPKTQQACQMKHCPIDCIVDQWLPWTACRCENGQNRHQNRTRTILQIGRYGGKSCPYLFETQECPTCPEEIIVHTTKTTHTLWIPAIIGSVVVALVAYIIAMNC